MKPPWWKRQGESARQGGGTCAAFYTAALHGWRPRPEIGFAVEGGFVNAKTRLLTCCAGQEGVLTSPGLCPSDGVSAEPKLDTGEGVAAFP